MIPGQRRAKAEGVYRIRRYAGESHEEPTGKHLGTMEARNAIQTAGKELLLDLMIGASTAYFDNANSVLQVTDGAGTDLFTQSGADSGFPDASTSKQLYWEWTDASTNTYTVDTIRLRQGSLTGTIFSEVTGGPFTDNSKPSDENWTYEYTLTISGDVADLQDGGLNAILEIMAGVEDDNFDNPGTVLRVEDSSGSLVGTVNTDSGYPSRSGTTVTWQFTSADGDDLGEWYDPIVKAQAWTDTVPVLSQDAGGGNSEGTKSSGEEWQYTYDFSI